MVSQSPTEVAPGERGDTGYMESWTTLAKRIRDGNAFSGNERNCVFLNTGKGGQRFADMAWATGMDDAGDGRGLAFGDWDFDGDVDVWMTFRDGKRVRYFENGLVGDGAGGSFVALKLEGDGSRRCNRDAIGARVKLVTSDGLAQVQTLHAGDTFLGQSSKWMHFGVPAGASVETVEVAWPGSRGVERFAGVENGGRYELKQAVAVAGAVRWRAPGWGVADEREVDVVVPGPIRSRLSRPVLSADGVSYRGLDGEVRESREGPLLVMLWATWCPDCETQMKAMAEGAEVLKGAGVRVLALCIDGVDGKEVEASTVAAHVAGLGFDFEVGFADAALVERLDGLQRGYFYRQPQLPVPSGFLFDQRGYLNVVYKGEAQVARMAADVVLLGSNEEETRKQSLPFGGRDADRVFETNPVAVARIFLGGGYPGDARKHLMGFLENRGAPRMEADTPAARAHNARMADVVQMLALADRAEGHFESALARFQEAVDYNPLLLPAQIGIGRSYQQLGRLAEAKAHFSKMRTVDDRVLEVHARLGEVHEMLGEWGEAAVCYRRILKLQPKSIPALNSLAWLLATAPDEAVRDGQEALKVAKILEGSPVRNHPSILDTMAAAYAAAGQYGNAVKLAERALERGVSDVGATRERLALYRARKGWIRRSE